MSSKRYPSRLESRAGFFASTRDECLFPRVPLECHPEIPVAPGEERWLLDTSLDEVYWPCTHWRAIPSFLSQLEWTAAIANVDPKDTTAIRRLTASLCDLRELLGIKSDADSREQEARIANLRKQADKEDDTASAIEITFSAGPEEWNE